MKRPRDPVRRKGTLICGEEKWLLHHDSADSRYPNMRRRSFPVSVLASLASVDFFPKLKYVLKGRRFESVEMKFSGRATQYSKRGFPGMFPKLEEKQGAMYEEQSSALREGQSLKAPKPEHDLLELFVMFGDSPRVARPEAVCVCVYRRGGLFVLKRTKSGTEHNTKWKCTCSQNTLLWCRNKCPFRGVGNFFASVVVRGTHWKNETSFPAPQTAAFLKSQAWNKDLVTECLPHQKRTVVSLIVKYPGIFYFWLQTVGLGSKEKSSDWCEQKKRIE